MIGLFVVKSEVELVVREAVRVLLLRLQLHQVDHVDDAEPHVRELLPEEVDGRQRLQRRDVAGAGHDRIRLVVLVVARPLPDPDPRRHVLDRLVHVQVLQGRLLARHDHVDRVAHAQALVGDGEQRVGVRRQVDPDHLGLLVDDVVDEARILVGEPVVVLPPHV